MTRVPIDRTENDPGLFVQVLDEFEGRAVKPLPHHLQPRDKDGRWAKKEDTDV